MGSVQGKNKTNSVATPITNENIPNMPHGVSPLYAIAASLRQEDPRSPGGKKRTPVSTPFDSPALTRVRGGITRLGSTSKLGTRDPRSPASKRTPVRKSGAANQVKVTPPPFSLGDPRSPLTFVTRTPLALSTQDAVVVPDDVVIATEELYEEVVVCEIIKKEDKEEKKEEANVDAEQSQASSSAAAESTTGKMVTETYTPSPTVMALTMSPLNSPVGGRKRKENLIKGSHSPLKKSYSAPDENAPPSPPINKPLKNRDSSRVRAPLSPLSLRTTNSNCMAIQPIKLRMDPGILG